jgi:hypothetical protein
MRYFLPDSQDLVDPSFDFERERRSATRQRQQDDLYAHEVFGDPVIDGVLVSKGIVEGSESSGGRFSLAQRHRLLRVGAREFFRIDSPDKAEIATMGDCGAFTYVKEKVPPYTVDDVIKFYVDCGFDYGISVDHVILAFDAALDKRGADVPRDLRERQQITLDLARDFLRACKRDRLSFEPLGVAQGWSPKSYANATKALQRMGYKYIAVGGMVPLKTREVLLGLEAIHAVRHPETRLHLLGVTRVEKMREFARLGVHSFDSTSPLRQAFKDDKDNYYTPERTYLAVRVPQIDGNQKLQKLISSGKVPQDEARVCERRCLDAMRRLDAGNIDVEEVIEALRVYEKVCQVESNHWDAYREVLRDRPWKNCRCEVCAQLGHHVILFRGAERNRRRGFHNAWVFYKRLQREMQPDDVKRRSVSRAEIPAHGEN